MKKIFTCGGTSWNAVITLDEFPLAVPQTIHDCIFNETLGNTGAGKALNFARLGFETTLHTVLGEDCYATYIREELKAPNLTIVSDLDPKGTERHLNLLNKHGQRISIFTNPSSDTPTIAYEQLVPYIAAADFVVINISNYCRELLPISKRFEKLVWTDLHDYDGKNTYHDDFIKASDYIFFSSENFPDYRTFMETQIDQGKQLIVCTHAEKGATALTNTKEWIEVSAITDYTLHNSNGAGDAFLAGFIYGFSKGFEIAKCMRYATIAGGLTIESSYISNPKLRSSNILEKEYKKHYKD